MIPPRRLRLCLALLALSLPLGEGLSVAALVLWLGCAARSWRHLDWRAVGRLPWRLPLQGLALYAVAGLLGGLVGGYGVVWGAALGRSIYWLILPLTAVCRPWITGRLWRQTAATFAVALAAASLFGAWQAACDGHLLEALSRREYRQASQAWVPGTARSVAAGFFYHRLKMAHVLLVGLCGVLPWALWPSRWRRRAAGLAGLFVAALGLTHAHGAWGSAAVAGGLLVLLRWQPWRLSLRRSAFLGGLAAAGALGLTAWFVLRGPPLPVGDASHGRRLIWEQAVRIIEEHPWGIGLGNYPRVVSNYYATLPPHPAPRAYPHQLWLAAWAEAGPFGLLGSLVFWWSLLQTFLRRACAAADVDGRCRAAGGAAMVVACCTLGSGHDVFYHVSVMVTFCCGLAWALVDVAARPSDVLLDVDP